MKDSKNIIFEEEEEINEENINEYNKDSMLMGWFKLNEENHGETDNMIYSEIYQKISRGIKKKENGKEGEEE